MSKKTIVCERDPVGDRLRREAIVTRPAFSELLHEKMAAAVQECREAHGDRHAVSPWRRVVRAVVPGRHHRPGRRLPGGGNVFLRRVAACAAAACLAVMLVGVGWYWKSWQAGVGSPRDLAQNAVQGRAADGPAPVRAADARNGATTGEQNLNHLVYADARRAAHVLLNRLPIDLALADITLVDE